MVNVLQYSSLNLFKGGYQWQEKREKFPYMYKKEKSNFSVTESLIKIRAQHLSFDFKMALRRPRSEGTRPETKSGGKASA